jgi:hypothetical protein
MVDDSIRLVFHPDFAQELPRKLLPMRAETMRPKAIPITRSRMTWAGDPCGNGGSDPRSLVAGGERIFPVRRLAPNGLEAWAQVLQRGYEGMIGKDDASPYEGGRTKRWLKVKVPGWTAPENRWHRARL